MDPVTIEVALPGLIDGTPFDVERRVLADLEVGMDQLAEYIDEASKQLANAERSRLLAEHGAKTTGEELGKLYNETTRAGALARMRGAAKALVGAAAEL